MTTNLDGLSLNELKKLSKDVEKAIAAEEKRARREAMNEIKAVAAKHGVDLSDLVGGEAPKKPGPKPGAKRGKSAAKKPKAPPRYANPQDKSQTWSGRGRRPEWVNAALKSGKELSDLSI